MGAVHLIVDSIGLVVGSLAATAALLWVLWRIFVLIHHPDWIPIAIAALVGLGVTGHLPRSGLLTLVLAYATAAAIPMWLAGRSWRQRHKREQRTPMKQA